MGFRRSTLVLVFEDPELEGLEIRAKRFSLRDLFALGDLAWGLKNNDPTRLDALTEMLAKKILSWNLEDDGMPVAVSPQAIGDLDEDLLSSIIRAITRASKGLDAPFETPPQGGQTGTGTDPDLEASIPMT